MPLGVHVVAFTHQGRVREHNEDSLCVGSWVRTEPMTEPRQSREDLSSPFAVLVCDGMGGHAAGEVASGVAVLALSKDLDGPRDEAAITAALRTANRAVFEAAAAPGGRAGMGTTVAGLWLSEERLVWFNVGDSRVYRVRDGYLRQLSIDDVEEAADAHRTSHAITQALGGLDAFDEVHPHLGEEPVNAGWRYLICSDGLTDMLDLQQIQSAIGEDAVASSQSLFDAAMAAGGADNISIILATIVSDPAYHSEASLG